MQSHPHIAGKLAAFGDELAACTSVDEVLEAIVLRAAALVGEGAMLSTVSDDGRLLVPAAFHHEDPDVLAVMRDVAHVAPYPIEEGFASRAVLTRSPVVWHHKVDLEFAGTDSPALERFAPRYPVRALIIVPMIGYGEVVGTLGVVRFENDAPYLSEALIALEALAERAALTLAEVHRKPHELTAADYEAIFRHSRDGVLFTVPDGRILGANPAACQILRRSERDICVIGRDGLVVHDEDLRSAIAQRAATGRARGEIVFRRGDGSEFVADASSTVFANEQGELRACVTFRDISEQVRLRAELEDTTRRLEQLAREDELTKLRNRRGLAADAVHTLAIADRDDEPVQIAFFDIDGLKRINDRFGHDTGDEVLCRLASALEAETRASDITARLGGDEFVTLLYGATPQDAERSVRRVAAACADGDPEVVFSYGIVERQPGSELSLDHLIHEADQRMYARKAARYRGDDVDVADC